MSFQNFYRVLEEKNTVDNAMVYTIQLNKAHDIFRGHFPGKPVTPGVAMLQIIKDLTEGHTGKSLFMQEVKDVKFLSVVDPMIEPMLLFSLRMVREANIITVKNNTSTPDATPVLKCNVTFVEE